MTEDNDLPIVHVVRPTLPWRMSRTGAPTPYKTECGLPIAGHPVITRAEFLEKIKKQGQQRAYLTTCQTCLDTARRWPSWDEDPVQCLSREVSGGWNGRTRDPNFKHELLALAMLAERHRPEFEELLEDQREIVPIGTAKEIS